MREHFYQEWEETPNERDRGIVATERARERNYLGEKYLCLRERHVADEEVF